MSTIDYPDKPCSVLFLGGCPFRCPFCQNPDLVLARDCREIEVDELVKRFEDNREFIDAITITGGEPLAQAKALKELCKKLKEKGFKVKIDTNGYYPEELEDILPLVDAVAMDLKTRLEPAEYKKATGFAGDAEELLKKVLQSIEVIKKFKGFKEFRTTVVPGLNDSAEDVKSAASAVPFADKYAVQQFRSDFEVLDPAYKKVPNTAKEKLFELAAVAKAFVANVVVKTLDGEYRV